MNNLTTEEFIKRAKECHEIKYDYSKTKYTGRHKKVCIICPEHGEFWQEAGSHLKGTNCPKCPCQYSQSKFISNAHKIHKNYYNYSKTKYTRMHDPVIIICPKHGEFYQKLYKHLNGQGCPICGQIKSKQAKISKGEQFIKNWLIDNKIKFSWQYPIVTNNIARNSNIIFVDFYVEYNNKQIIIEYNGKQHYTRVSYFQHSEEDFLKQKRRDKVLESFCKTKNINLVEFKYTLSLQEVEE